MTALTDLQIQRLAKARVGFRIHALVYLAVNVFLIAVWFVTTRFAGPVGNESYGSMPGFWPIWPELGWGVGLLIHGFVVYGGGSDWQRREEERIRRAQPPPPRA
jgi:hypothetical protein